MSFRRTMSLCTLAAICTSVPTTLAQDQPGPAEIVRQIEAEHAGSLIDLCRELDEQLVILLPGWSDHAARSALLGVPIEPERIELRERIKHLSAFITAAEPVLQAALREADDHGDEGIEAAVQLAEVLLPLARARALLLYGAAEDPALGLNDESRRAFEESIALAERTESVSAWTDVERGLIIASAAIRLNRTDRASEAIRAVRLAIREQPQLAEQVPDLLSTRAALETLLIAVARSPVEARDALPDDPDHAEDQERLRLRLVAMSAERASTLEQRDRLLIAEADRQANRALDQALASDLQIDRDRPRWIEPLLRSAALIDETTANRLGGSASSAYALLEAIRVTPADGGSAKIQEMLGSQNLSGLAVLGSILELRVGLRPAASATDVPALILAASDLHLLAPDAPVTHDAMRHIATTLRSALRSGIRGVSRDAELQSLTMDLIDAITSRHDLGRSNLDLLAMASLGTGDLDSANAILHVSEAAHRIAAALERTNATDEDASWAAASVGAALFNAVARHQVLAIFDEGLLDPEQESRCLSSLSDLASRMDGLGTQSHQSLRRTILAMDLVEQSKGGEALELLDRDQQPGDFVAPWAHEMIRTRAALQGGSSPQITTDGHRYGAALFALRDVPARFDLRGSIPSADDRWDRASAALAAGAALMTPDPAYTRLSIRCLSAALRTEERQTLGSIRASVQQAQRNYEHADDQNWAAVIDAEAALRLNDDEAAFTILRGLVQRTPVEDRGSRAYWYASMRMLEILSRQNADGSRTQAIAREIRRLKLQPSWGAHEDLAAAINEIVDTLRVPSEP